jgi:hypothetical protein
LACVPVAGQAQFPGHHSAGPLIRGAQAKGHSFKVDELALGYDEKAPGFDTSFLRFAILLKNITLKGNPIVVTVDKDDVNKEKLAINALCNDIFDISGA